MSSLSFWRGANLDCNSAEATLPPAVVTMAWRMLMTPPLLDAAEPAAAGACAEAAVALITQAAARAAVRINIFRDRKTVNNLEFTFFLLVVVRHGKTGTNPRQVSLAKIDSAPRGFTSVSQTRKYTRRSLLPAIRKPDCADSPHR